MKEYQENILQYINYDTGVSAKKTLQSSFIMYFMVGIPSSLFGAYSNITRVILLPFIITFTIWTIYLLINKKYSKGHYVLFLGAFSLFASFLFMIAAYKFALMAYKITILQIFLIILMYVITSIVNILNVVRLIKKGYYKDNGKNENPLALFFAMSVLGLSMGKMFTNASQETAIIILVSCLLFLSFLFATGIHNFLKYYIIKANAE